MWLITTQEQIDEIERERALVATFLDRTYNPEKIEWLFDARDGFNEHARDAWHLLIPSREGYGVDAYLQPNDYGVALAAAFIDKLEVDYAALPCIAFRARGEDCFYLKLGGKNRDEFCEEIGRVSDVARKCQSEGPEDPDEFRDYVNMHVAIHLRQRRALSAARSALPAISALIGGVVDFKEII